MRADIRRASHALYDAIERFSATRGALALLFVWAVAEATVWPLLADFALAPLALVCAGRRTWALAAAAIAGMAVGGIVSVLVSSAWPGFALDLLRDLPLLTEAHIAGARDELADRGVAGFLVQPWSGIPFKAWAVMAGQQGLAPLLVIGTFIAARATRMLITAAVARLLGRAGGGWLRDWFAVVAVLYLAVFVAGFAAIVL